MCDKVAEKAQSGGQGTQRVVQAANATSVIDQGKYVGRLLEGAPLPKDMHNAYQERA